MPIKIRVLLLEDDLDFVFLIKKELERDAGLEIIGHAADAKEGVRLAKELMPDIALVDLSLSKNDMDGIGAAREIRLSTNARVLLLTSFEQPEIVIGASKKSFASGYIFKSRCQALTEVIHEAAHSRSPQAQFIRELLLQALTPAERQILNIALGEDATVRSTEKTIANQKTSIFKKLGLKNTNELMHIFKNW